MSAIATETLPDAQGHFGQYGGRYVPETLMHPLKELEEEYFRTQQDPEFHHSNAGREVTRAAFPRSKAGRITMNGIIYLVGLIVIVMAVLSLLGLR